MEAIATKTSNLKIVASTEEMELVRRSIKGEQRAQHLLYKKYVKAMYHTVIRMVANTPDAEDIVQEVFVKVFSHLHTFQAESTLGAWIKRITINTTLNFLRKHKQIHFVEIDNQTEWTVEAPLHENPSQWNMTHIHQAIQQLPHGCRVIFNLFLLEGYQHQEIAQILNISASTSKSQYQRARKLLQKILRERVR